MCFVIKKGGKKPLNRKAWKRVLVKPDGTMVSWYNKRFVYQAGEVKAKAYQQKSIARFLPDWMEKWKDYVLDGYVTDGLRAKAGIYVFLTREAAEMYSLNMPGVKTGRYPAQGWRKWSGSVNNRYVDWEEAVIEVRVSPKDFIGRAWDCPEVATYTKVVVPETQPFVELY